MKRLYTIEVQGRHHSWGWYAWGTPQDVADWRADGLEVFEVLNVIPDWVVRLGLTRIWVAVEDLLVGRWGRG
ncbi:hypothetical protein [Meiothermus hypogaeus]|uniref:Uncharacterized protein n=2 Tax=Meiothermus hypogaeus TaxID=884155 RepID=A0A511QY42_9DEIN|nr:hypothetical protein [Meiothermus hypogaeus]RIH78979.1 hypothetical protein Mhypo_01342 [Meiothermus hypogaeus]GEM81907.1 hypothetical protein MHY01S_00730 [Meiothermus hypogaeus NBRC 106114]